MRTGNAIKILIVDDDFDDVKVLAMLLRKLDYEVKVALGCQEAVACVRSWRPDCTFMDLSMPLFDGFEVARLLRLELGCADLRMIALTGCTDNETLQRLQSERFDGHILKPAHVAQIIMAIPKQL